MSHQGERNTTLRKNTTQGLLIRSAACPVFCCHFTLPGRVPGGPTLSDVIVIGIVTSRARSGNRLLREMASNPTSSEIPIQVSASHDVTGVSSAGASRSLLGAGADLEAALHATIGHGPFQRRAFLATLLATVVLFSHDLVYRDDARGVDHWCKPPDDLDIGSMALWKNVAIPMLPDGSFSRCTMYDPPVKVSS